MNTEIRNPKSEDRKKPEIRNPSRGTSSSGGLSFGLRHSCGMRHLVPPGRIILAAVALTCVYAQPDRPDAPRTRTATRIGTNRVTITVSGGQRVIEANGWPDHQPGQFPNRGNPNSISEQNYNFHVPLAPQVAATPVSSARWWFGVAINGVPFEPGTAEFWNGER